DRLRSVAIQPARPRLRGGVEDTDEQGRLLRRLRPDDRRAPRPAVRNRQTLLRMERQLLALRDHANAEGDGEPAAELRPEGRYSRRLSEAAANLREDASQEWQAVSRRGVPSRHRLGGGQ